MSPSCSEAQPKSIPPPVPRDTQSEHLDNLATDYLEREIFPLLLPALKDMLHEARRWDCLYVQKCRFNGIDYLAELLWNRNRRHPYRSKQWREIFSIPFVKRYLKKHPRPYFPLSWLWTPEEAALRIQAQFRGFLVRKQPEVQEMRQFWKALQAEKEEEMRQRREELRLEATEAAAVATKEVYEHIETVHQQMEEARTMIHESADAAMKTD
ncbi:IQ domain-containing protein K-like [Schistocerca cancellata]|uniref:IQ domain-containing protein K-like n=1 Tax=Schistocerca cancellata TaxID=274614 RepID=UPI0021181180|nr:IQ domain-containing protein K-like [Schistocerca cancellata]